MHALILLVPQHLEKIQQRFRSVVVLRQSIKNRDRVVAIAVLYQYHRPGPMSMDARLGSKVGGISVFNECGEESVVLLEQDAAGRD
jgi:hypothetical protein